MRCLACGSPLLPSGREYTLKEILESWEKVTFPKSLISWYCRHAPTTRLYTCADCGFGIFIPPVSGTPEFYDAAYKGEPGGKLWYSEKKWDYDILKSYVFGKSVLEVGCGDGTHLKEIQSITPIAEGTEYNPKSVHAARKKGLVVYDAGMAEMPDRKYDLVVSIHVIEHVERPDEFIDYCLEFLKPGGRLCISFPNQDVLKNIIPCAQNMPPHHITRWTEKAIRAFADKTHLQVDVLAREPLEISYHYYYSYYWLGNKISRGNPAGWLLQKGVSGSFEILKSLGVKHVPYLNGQSIYTVMSRRE